MTDLTPEQAEFYIELLEEAHALRDSINNPNEGDTDA